MATYLIVNADDFGISLGVSQGIIEAYHNGIVTSTTAMVNMPDAAESIALAHASAPDLGIGLHLNLSFGKPVLSPDQVPSLLGTDGAMGPNWDALHARAVEFESDEVRAELEAQMARFIDIAGHPPDHIDSHHEASYWLPSGFETMLELANEYGIPIRCPEPLGAVQETILARSARPQYPGRIWHEPTFFDENATFDNLHTILTGLGDGPTELVCHPGYAQGLNEAYADPRERELAVLTDPKVRVLVADLGIRLVSFGDLFAG